MQQLKIYQSLWAMELRNPDIAERPHEESFAMVAQAGYDGMCVDPSVGEIEATRELLPLYERHELECMVNAFPGAEGDMRPLYALANDANASLVNIIGGVMPIKPENAVPVIRRWMDEADSAGLPVLFETHRDSLLNDLYYTLQVMDLMPEMRLCADLSHFVVDREMRDPISSVDRDYIERVLRRSDCFQGRIANREQVQVQIDFPQHQQWVEIFKGWWKFGIREWRQRNSDDATLHFLCELGPPPYAITDGSQHELSDRWDEALKIRGWVETIWNELCDEDQ
ncbi:MAG: hypothetical protein ACI88G_000637 [Woeseiaceae bacterium]|jgi:hypothetical protein